MKHRKKYKCVNVHFARSVWILSDMGWQSTGLQCFSDWFRVVFVSVGVENATKMIMICWSLWYNRNLIVWEHKFKSPQQVYSLSMRYLQEWRAAATPLVQQNGSNVSSRSWQRPDSRLH